MNPAHFLTFLAIIALLVLPACSKEAPESTPDAPSDVADAGTSESETRTVGPYTWAADINIRDPKYVKCWASIRATPSKDFPNGYDNIKGPVEVTNLHNLTADGRKLLHDDWRGRITWIKAGANARITIYSGESLRGVSHTIEPDEEIELSDTKLDRIASMRIEYTS